MKAKEIQVQCSLGPLDGEIIQVPCVILNKGERINLLARHKHGTGYYFSIHPWTDQASVTIHWLTVNCETCGTGKHHWYPGPRCRTCDGDPLVWGSGRPDWKDYGRARMILQFGPRLPGDEALLAKYREELHTNGYPL